MVSDVGIYVVPSVWIMPRYRQHPNRRLFTALGQGILSLFQKKGPKSRHAPKLILSSAILTFFCASANKISNFLYPLLIFSIDCYPFSLADDRINSKRYLLHYCAIGFRDCPLAFSAGRTSRVR